MMPPDVGDADPAHESAQGLVASGPQDQMPVIPHQAVGQEVHRITFQSFGQHTFEGLEVFVLMKQVQASVSAVQDVMNQARFDASFVSWHDAERT
jgi:hypothetical protein